jgi:hypothetical protein
MVVSLCAIIRIVSFEPDFAIASIALWTSYSDLGSSAEVASSRIKILGYLIKALAMAILCFYPPDIFMMPAVPTKVSSFYSYSRTKLALAYSSACSISFSEASLFP